MTANAPLTTGGLFLSSNVQDVRAYISSRTERFYVYILRRPDGSPFYVGKGGGNRCRLFSHASETLNSQHQNHKLNIIRSITKQGGSVKYELDSFFDDEQECFAREVELLLKIGRYDLGAGPLTNGTDGGEGTCNPSTESKQRAYEKWCGTDDDSDSSVINRFFLRLAPTEAVPLKPIRQLRIEPLTPRVAPLGFTRRQAAAVLASAIANGVVLESGCEVPRRLTIDGVESIIENGVGRDILKSGLATLSPGGHAGAEILLLDALAIDYIVETFGRRMLESIGVLNPKAAAV